MKIGLISCTKKKRKYPCKAREMYSPSTLFKKAWNYCQLNYDKTLIISAKHYLLDPEQEIDPYDLSLYDMNKREYEDWAHNLLHYFDAFSPQRDVFYIHAGVKYRHWLVKGLTNEGFKYHVPLEGLGIGQQLKWYSDKQKQGTVQRTLQ